MEQLSGSHSLFLHTERGNVYNHVSALGVYDPSTAPAGKADFGEIVHHFSDRIHLHKQLRQRLLSVPLGLDRPYWIEAPEIDLHFHLRRVVLPPPRDWQQLIAEAAAIHSRPLDRSPPLWEIHVLEGLDGMADLPRGSFAVIQKYHHCAGGQQLVALMRAVHSPSAGCEASETDRPSAADEQPTAMKLCGLAVANGIRRAASLCALSGASLNRVACTGAAAFFARFDSEGHSNDPDMSLPGFERAPVTRFNGKVSASRTVALVGLPLSAMKRAQTKLDGVTVNDIFLAVVGGALRKYLDDKGELPVESLVALMPLGGRDARDLGDPDEAPGVPTPVRSDIADPVVRLMACHAASRAARARVEALSKDFPRSLMDHLPNGVAEMFLRRYIYPHLNVTVSNVRGPDEALYMGGARLMRLYILSIATDYLGLNHSGFSYDGTLWIAAVGCRKMLPDPDVYARYLRDRFDELMSAVDLLSDEGSDAHRSLPILNGALAGS